MKLPIQFGPGLIISLCLGFSSGWQLSAKAQNVETAETTVLERGANHKVVQHVTWTTDEKSEAVAQTNSFTELATGLNFKNEKGEWEESREEIEILAKGAGAAARYGQHKVFFPPDIYDGQIELQTSDGQWLRSRVLGLSYYDSKSGKSVLIAETTNSVGEVQGKNVVIYPEAFTDIRASLRLTYTKAGFEQDVVLSEQPPSPEKFGLNPETTRLQVLTEFFNPPQPEKREQTVTDSKGETVVDEQLDFGALQMVPGKAFSLDQADGEKKIPVKKQWLKLEGRDFLIEEVEVSAVAKELEALPKARSASLQSNTNAVRQARLGKPVLPAQRQAAKKPASKPMRMAKASSLSKGFVMDYATVNTGQNNYTFKGDTTYYISAAVTLSGTTTFEAGAVIKYAVNASLTLYITTGYPVASLNWQATAYRPVILTAKDDNTVGETISGSTGNPVGGVYYANPALDVQSAYGVSSLQYVRFCYAQQALTLGSSSSLNLSHAQFVKCFYGVGAGNYQAVYANLRNALFSNVSKPFNFQTLYYEATISAQHVTFDTITALVNEGLVTSYSLNLANCILANVAGTGWAGNPSDHLAGNNNAFYTTPFNFGTIVPCPANPFQAAVGAGNYYLKVDAGGNDTSGLRNQGTTSIDATQ